ncbi:MAG: patatin-like phospholipase family protein [Planctomycetaceae bacterium]|nr:patatin-like phospholipase family protein [Planctomycetaceae bacterium]
MVVLTNVNNALQRAKIVDQAPPPYGFSEVLSRELNAIRERRRRNGIVSDESDDSPKISESGTSSSPNKTESEQEVRCQAFQENLVGLSFSGGGIRSATFNLGVLQGLADSGLLTRFDYLSTVSGGGYIGSWLAAWIKREGDAKNVEKQLRSCWTQQAEANRGNVPKGKVLDSEPEPIHHLRAYSNYLTPQLGVMSVDTWVLGSIYIRNLLLNLLVLIPFLVGLIMSERLLILCFLRTTDLTRGEWEKQVWMGGLVLFVVMLISVFVWIHRSMMQVKDSLKGEYRSSSYRLERKYLHRYILIPMLVLSVLSTWLVYGSTKVVPGKIISETIPILNRLSQNYLWMDKPWFMFLLSGCAMSIIVGIFHFLSGFDHGHHETDASLTRSLMIRFQRIGLGLLTGFLGGLLLYGLFYCLHQEQSHFSHSSLLALTFGPPAFLVVMNLIAFLQVGMISRLWSEAIREWWASLCGSSMIYLFGWLFIFGLSIWGPWMILVLEEQIGWIDKALLAGWVSAVGSGVVALGSSEKEIGSFKKIFLKILPYIFIIGLIILASFLTDYFVPPPGPSENAEKYLTFVEAKVEADQDTYLLQWMPWIIAGLFGFTYFASFRIDVNSFGLHALYKNRLVRCYLGASRPKAWFSDGSRQEAGAPTNVPPDHPRSPNPITGFDPHDDLSLSSLYVDPHGVHAIKRKELQSQLKDAEERIAKAAESFWPLSVLSRWHHGIHHALLNRKLSHLAPDEDYVGPYPIINTALNLVHTSELQWQERKAESFTMTPQFCGSSMTKYSPTDEYSGGITLGEAVSISGAAVSPNMGVNSRGPVTALLAIFNMRLGAWLGNPERAHWTSPGPKNLLKYFLHEVFGLTNAGLDYIYLSDGGHFENLGLYELLRRRCRFIVVCDSGADPEYSFADLGGVVRKARVDFGIGIDIEVEQIVPQGENRISNAHVAIGTIHYEGVKKCHAEGGGDNGSGESTHYEKGTLIYIKPALTGDEPQDVINYRTIHPSYPHESTSDQWFSESQFESYRTLGWHIAKNVFEPGAGMEDSQESTPAIFSKIASHWKGVDEAEEANK